MFVRSVLRWAITALCLALVVLGSPRLARAAAPDDAGACGAGPACGVDETPSSPLSGSPPSVSSADAGVDAAATTLLFFWGVGCPHCEEAKPFVAALARERPDLRVESIEVRSDALGRERFLQTMQRVEATAIGVPTFVVGDRHVVGYEKGATDAQVRALLASAKDRADAPRAAGGAIRVPLLGEVHPATVSLPMLTLTIGLLDGINPCAIWVLLVLLGILLHVKAPGRTILYAGTFVVMSGVVYFAFMTAWLALFQLVGLSRLATVLLGAVLVVMGAINLKELVWFKKGPSLVIPDKAKPGLYRRMRAIAGSAKTPAALLGIVALAFVVNLIELGCTVGLPAIYTRILALRGLGVGARYGYLALYNVAYVTPLFTVVVVFLLARRRFTLSERVAKVLKGVSGALLVSFGGLFLFAPGVLVGM